MSLLRAHDGAHGHDGTPERERHDRQKPDLLEPFIESAHSRHRDGGSLPATAGSRRMSVSDVCLGLYTRLPEAQLCGLDDEGTLLVILFVETTELFSQY